MKMSTILLRWCTIEENAWLYNRWAVRNAEDGDFEPKKQISFSS
jgi:hypothetical protein